MKTAVSLPDPLFRRADRFARDHRISRSRLFAQALAEYLDSRGEDETTEQINRVCREVDTRLDPTLARAATRVLRKAEWND